MPSVSGETLDLPLSCSSQTLARTAGITAFCASSPAIGATSAPRLAAYFFSTSLFAIYSFQMRSTVLTTSSGTPFGRKMPK